MNLSGKRILLGITGGIAAYRSAETVRRLREAGATVQVVMTEGAARFVTPLTFQALSGRPVRTTLWDESAEAAMSHIELARWADAVLVAPASADFLAGLAHGLASDLLLTLCLATESTVAVAPAMNRAMWAHPATRDNIATLETRGVSILGPGSGPQACGEIGEGRMLAPEALTSILAGLFGPYPLEGIHVLISAGPTREPVDPVRFLSNRSSGKMGFALAQASAEAGAAVTLVTGPVCLDTPTGVSRTDVETGVEMHHAIMDSAPRSHIFIANAAVSDYRPEHRATAKIKKHDDHMTMQLVRNPDIVADVARLTPRPFIVGFAAETHDLATNARSKLASKGLDMVAANRVGEPGSGFESEDNALEIFWQKGRQTLPKAAKIHVARQLITLVAEHYAELHALAPRGRPPNHRSEDPR